MPAIEKLIVTNRSALARKYGPGVAKIDAALARLVAADAARGLVTRCIPLDGPALGGSAVTRPADYAACKRAIDKLAKQHRPDYVVILGAPDIVPHVSLKNPADDEDASVPSDLPYACEAAFSRDVRKFLSPTRVVGRIPDIAAHEKAVSLDPAYLVRQLDQAAKWKSRPRADYQSYFGLSTFTWRASTELSLANLFGGVVKLNTSPPGTPKWSKQQLKAPVHFINCHGAESDWRFYGERYGQQPEAHDSRHLSATKAIVEGTVVAAECCYGAELYAPAKGGARGICNAYLDLGAYAFLGSTTIAYGPESGNGYADLICQYFIDRVLRGASSGRALLEARQRYLQAASELDEVDLKTIAQFHLLGDPSVHPVMRAEHALAGSKAFQAAFKESAARRAARFGRRAWMLRSAHMIESGIGAVARQNPFSGGPRVRRTLLAAAREAKLKRTRLFSYRLRDPIGVRLARELGKRDSAMVHVITGGRFAKPPKDRPDSVKIVALVRGGEIVSLRKLEAR